MSDFRITEGDCREHMAAMDAESVAVNFIDIEREAEYRDIARKRTQNTQQSLLSGAA